MPSLKHFFSRAPRLLSARRPLRGRAGRERTKGARRRFEPLEARCLLAADLSSLALLEDTGYLSDDLVTTNPTLTGTVDGQFVGTSVYVEFDHDADGTAEGSVAIAASGDSFTYDPRLADSLFASLAGAKQIRARTVEYDANNTLVASGEWASFEFVLAGSSTPSLSIDSVTVNESAGAVTFTVTLSAPTDELVSVDWSAGDGSAVRGEDWQCGVWVEGYWEQVWVEGHYEQQWVDGYYEEQWVDGYWEDGEWVEGYWQFVWVDGYTENVWVEGYYEDVWVDGYWDDDVWVWGYWEEQWIDGYWTDPAWIEGYYEDVWVDGYWEGEDWIEGYYEQVWVDGYYADAEWVEGHYDYTWIEGHWEEQWVDGHFTSVWVEGYYEEVEVQGYYEQVWVDGYYEDGQWIDGHYEDVWVDGYYTEVWVDGYFEDVWIDGYWLDENQLVFDPGQTVMTITIALLDDSMAEATESFYVYLANATNATIAVYQGTATIIDND